MNRLKRRSSGGKNDPLSAQGVSDLLALIGYQVPTRVAMQWDQTQRKEVATWAYGTYLGPSRSVIPKRDKPQIIKALTEVHFNENDND